MTPADFNIAIFYRVDHQMLHVPKPPQAALYPSAVVTLGVLYALKGGSKRAFYRWQVWDWRALFPRRPSRTRLFRLFAAHADWTNRFRAVPTGAPRPGAATYRQGTGGELRRICPSQRWL